jgi:hypothetical protein
MKDMQASLEKLLTDAADAALIRDLATDPGKRELFTRLADHLAMLAAVVEREIATRAAEKSKSVATGGPPPASASSADCS